MAESAGVEEGSDKAGCVAASRPSVPESVQPAEPSAARFPEQPDEDRSLEQRPAQKMREGNKDNRRAGRIGEYPCSLSAHDKNVLGQCAQSDTHLFVLRVMRKREMNGRSWVCTFNGGVVLLGSRFL